MPAEFVRGVSLPGVNPSQNRLLVASDPGPDNLMDGLESSHGSGLVVDVRSFPEEDCLPLGIMAVHAHVLGEARIVERRGQVGS